MKRLSFFIFCFPFLLLAHDGVIDSLNLALKNAKHDTTRVKILSELGEMCEVEDILKYAEPCAELAEKNAALASTIALREFYLRNLSGAFNNIGFHARQQGDVAKALKYYLKSLKIDEEIKDKEGTASSLNNIGRIYDDQGDVNKALECYHKSLKIREEINEKRGTAESLNNIAGIYKDQGDIPKALEYYHRSLKILEEIKDKKGIAYSLNNIGFIYDNRGNIPKTLEYYQKSLKIHEEIKDKKGIAVSLNNIGSIYKYQGDISKALEYFHTSLKIREEIKDKEGIAYSLNNIAEIMLKQGQVSEALANVNRSLQIAKDLGYPGNIKNAASILKNIYKKQNKHKEAFEMYALEIQMRDSINNQETKKASIKKQMQYQYEKKAAADSVKNDEEQKVKNAQLTAQYAQLKQEKTQRFALYGGLVLVVAFLGFVYNRFRITQKQKVIIEDQKHLVDEAFKQLEEKNKEVMDSIHYAKRIQTALLPNEKYIDRKLNQLN